MTRRPEIGRRVVPSEPMRPRSPSRPRRRRCPGVGIVCVLLCTLLLQSAPRSQTANDIGKKVDSLFAEWDKPNSPGCALGIIRHGKLIYARGYGMADLEHQIPITSQTLFNIGSTSKQFTAACICLLAQRHKLSLDDDVRKYVPELPDYGSTITIRQLLNHTSGLRDYITLLYLSGVRVEDFVAPRDAMEIILRQKSLNFAPGEEWLYSNTGYFLASIIVDKVSGKPLPDFARENIFDPLGMKHTMWVDDPRVIIPNRAVGYASRQGGTFQQFPSTWRLVGDGGIYTSIEEMLKWDGNFYRLVVGGDSLIRELTTAGALNSGSKLDYGLGLFVGKYRGLEMVRHEGEWAGYKAEFLQFPKEEFSVICLCNLSSMVPMQLARRVADICLSDQLAPTEAGTAAPATAERPSPLSADDSSRCVGFYRNPLDESVRHITVKNGRLLYGRVPGAESELTPVGRGLFRMLGVPAQVSIRFTGDAGGHASGMEATVDSAAPIRFDRFEPISLDAAQLKEYAGTYYSEELDANYTVASRDSQLVIQIRRFDDLTLTPTIRDVFKYQDFRSFVFKRNGDGRIAGFSLSVGRAKNLAFVKLDLSAPGTRGD